MSTAIQRNLTSLARMLERMETGHEPINADQYRLVVKRLTNVLTHVKQAGVFQVVLENCRATAELYENLNYTHAGLCRSPLEEATNAELLAHTLIERIRKVHSKK